MGPLVIPEASLTERRQQFARVTATLAGLALFGIAATAHGQAALRDQTSGLAATTSSDQGFKWRERFAGSFVDLSTYVGSGTFYSSGYHNPYVSNALYLRPTFVIGTPLRLSLNARVYVEQEYTSSDMPTGRSFYPSDSWIFLTAKNLYTIPKAQVRFSGSVRTIFPTSWESRYAHLVMGVGASGAATRLFEFGKPNADGKRWNLLLNLGGGITKYARTSEVRGDPSGASSGCRQTATLGVSSGGVADADRCGGPLNTSFAIATSGMAAISRGALSLSVTLAVLNDFKYAIDADTALLIDPTNQISRGHNDSTWGIIALGYEINDHLTLSLGVSSFQPALDSRYQDFRFPFFDFSGTNANNATQAFVGLTGTL